MQARNASLSMDFGMLMHKCMYLTLFFPDVMKVPFQMFVAGFKYREIAEKLGLPMGTVKSRLFFIRKRLKEELKDFSS